MRVCREASRLPADQHSPTPMQVQSVRCHHCGAPLQVPENARFVTCQYCQSQLIIHRTACAVTTEVLADLTRKTSHLGDQLSVVRLQGDLDCLDREWQMKRAELLGRDPTGKLQEPRRVSPMQFFLVLVLCVPLVGTFARGDHSSMVPVIVTVIVVLAILGSLAWKKSPYQAAKLAYERQRSELQARLQQAAPPKSSASRATP
jgi:LSD1 subclass zinc finger protein